MKTFILVAAASAALAGFSLPLVATPADAVTFSVRIHDRDHPHYWNGRWYTETWWRAHHARASACRLVTIRTKHANGVITIRKIRRCD